MNFQITTTADSELSYTPCYKLVCGYMGDVNCSSVKRLAVMLETRFDSVFIHSDVDKLKKWLDFS